MKVKFK